jgi:hypothetical protein
MPEHDAGDTLARLLLPYRRRFKPGRGPLVHIPPDERPNDQPPERMARGASEGSPRDAGRRR